MAVLQDVSDIFSIFHDGTIYAWTGDTQLLTLIIDCQFLAECIDKSYTKFYVELTQVDELSLSTWPNPFDLPVQIFTDPSLVFKAELEILSADIMEEKVVVACSQHNLAFEYCGGNLQLLVKQ